MTDFVSCMPLKTVTDGPLFNKPVGTLSELVNMELFTDGYAEARGGLDKIKPSGGSVTAMKSSGGWGFSTAHQLASPYGVIASETAAGAISMNYQLAGQTYPPFPTGAANEGIYFGSDLPFASVQVSLSVAASWTVTLVYQYWNGSAWTTTTPFTTIDWTVLRTPQTASWVIPTAWATTSIGATGNQTALKYWMRVRISVSTAITTLPRIGVASIRASGIKQAFVSLSAPYDSNGWGELRQYGQVGTTGEYFSVGLVTSPTPSATNPIRLASYRGRVFFVNGVESFVWDGINAVVHGIPGSSIPFTLTRVAGGAGMDVGIYRYYAAVGHGPCDLTTAYSATTQQDALPRWGIGQATLLTPTGGADPADPSSIQTTAGNQATRFTLSGALSSSISSLYLYRTQDLTNVPIGQRANFPAFLIQSFRAVTNGTVEGNPYDDVNSSPLFPPVEAKTYNVSPPSGCKYVTVYQNRLVMADDETIYWSDAFTPDVFSAKATNYIRLGRATGGRITGIKEFGDQIVAWTEDQTWGITNLDLDVPNLYPIALGVGSVAPDAAAVGDGWLVWLSKHGFYAWDGDPQGPKKISLEMDQSFGKMSYESHGGSRGAIDHKRYTVRLSDPSMASPGTAYRYRLDTGKWSTITLSGFSSTLFPIGTIDSPIGVSDAGAAHIVWAKADFASASQDYNIYLGELTTQDNGSNYTCSATMHFQLPPNALIQPDRVYGYYSAADGWGTPSFSVVGGAQINSELAIGSTATNVGTDYSIAGAKFSQNGATSDVQLKFSVASAASGTVNRQRFFGGVLEGRKIPVPRFVV